MVSWRILLADWHRLYCNMVDQAITIPPLRSRGTYQRWAVHLNRLANDQAFIDEVVIGANT